MAIRKTGARRIAVDGECYLWRVRHRQPELDNRGWGWAFAVQHAERPGSTLVVNLARRHPLWGGTTPVRPTEVASWIRLALSEGWQPSTRGSPFQLSEPEEAGSPQCSDAEPGATADGGGM